MRTPELKQWIGDHKTLSVVAALSALAVASGLISINMLGGNNTKTAEAKDACSAVPLTDHYVNPIMNRAERTMLSTRCELERLVAAKTPGAYEVKNKVFDRLVMTASEFGAPDEPKSFRQIAVTSTIKNNRVKWLTIREQAKNQKFVLNGSYSNGWSLIAFPKEKPENMVISQYTVGPNRESDPARIYPIVDVRPKAAPGSEMDIYFGMINQTVADLGLAVTATLVHGELARNFKQEPK